MYIVQTFHFVVISMCIHEAYLQVPTLSVATSTPYICRNSVEIQCTYTGGPCCASTRLWRRNGSAIMTNGNPTAPADSNKYSEEINAASNYFSLIIKNIVDSDFASYTCEYGFAQPSTLLLLKDDVSSKCNILKNCGYTAGISFAVIVCLILPGIFIVSRFILGFVLRSKILVVVVPCAVSVIIGLCFALGVGSLGCDCKVWNMVLIALGFILPVVLAICLTVIIERMRHIYKEEGANADLYCPFKIKAGQEVVWKNKKKPTMKEGLDISRNENMCYRTGGGPRRMSVYHENGGYHLKLSNIRPEDEGVYECSVKGSRLKTTQIILHVTGGPSESNGSCWPPCRVGQELSTTETNNTNRT